jgi:hypothetical protein
VLAKGRSLSFSLGSFARRRPPWNTSNTPARRVVLSGLPATTQRVIRGARWALRRQHALEGALLGFIVGLGLAALLALACRLWPLLERGYVLAWVALTVSGVTALGALAGLVQPLSLMTAARAIDTRLGLRERVSTSLELAQHALPHDIPAAQIADTAAVLAGRPWRPAFRPRVARRPLFLAAGLGLVVTLALVLPDPQQQVLDERAASRQAVATAAQRVAAARERVLARPDLDPAHRAALAEQLRSLEQDLRRGDLDQRQAIARVAAAEAALRQSTDPATGRQSEGLAQLAQELMTSSYTTSAGRALRQNDPAGAAKDLSNLATRLDRLDQGEQQALANKLERAAATQAVSNSALAASLSASSQALQQGAAAQAGQHLDEAAQQLRDLAAAQAAARGGERAAQDLDQTRQELAGAGQAPASAGANPAPVRVTRGGQPAGQAAQAGQSGASAQASGTQGNGQGQGQGNGQSQGSGQGQGSSQGAGAGQGQVAGGTAPRTDGGTARRGQPVQDRPGTTGTSAYEPVYAPQFTGSSGEQATAGGSDRGQGQVENRPVQTDGSRTAPLVPYQQVYRQYREQATAALDEGTVPPALRDYVRDYFSALDGTGP